MFAKSVERRGVCGLAVAAVSLLLVACGGGSSLSNSGALNLSLTDGPVDDADAVVVAFTGVAVKPAAGGEIDIDFDTAKSIDLLALQGDVSTALLEDYALAAGQYNWIRLKVDEAASYIEVSGVQHALSIPSGSESGLKLNRTFTISAGEDQGFTIDFDLRSSVHQSGAGSYRLRPTLRIVDDSDRGHISGTVAAALLDGNSDCFDDAGAIDAAVYVYEGAGVAPSDVNIDADGGPTTTAKVTSDNGVYRYTAGFLPSATYTVALTCQADLDDGEQADTLTFLSSGDVAVTAEQTTQYDFVP